MKTITDYKKLRDLKATNPYLRLGTDVSDLEKSIRTVGLIAPLVVSEDNVILAGARRYQALLNLGFIEAPVIVIKSGELEKELISIDENLVRKDLNKIEIEGHLRRAKEIYQALHPKIEVEEIDQPSSDTHEVLPPEEFLTMVAEKTGLSPRQIHEAIARDERASNEVKEARQNGELSVSQTNEIVKLAKDDQSKALTHLKQLPVKDIKQFVKNAKTKGVELAIKESPKMPHAREFSEIESLLKRLNKKMKMLELEGIQIEHLPSSVQKLFAEFQNFSDSTFNTSFDQSSNQDLHLQ